MTSEPALRSVVVAIGRTIQQSADPLPASDWASFRASVRSAVEKAGAVFFFGDGTGIYEGRIEESHVVVGAVPDPPALDELRKTLDDLATTYRQDAIALITGEVEFRHD